jgi:hypothetical protein
VQQIFNIGGIWLNQSKTLGHCGFPLANSQSVSIVDCVPIISGSRST